jgi:hypothetical protein
MQKRGWFGQPFWNLCQTLCKIWDGLDSPCETCARPCR